MREIRGSRSAEGRREGRKDEGARGRSNYRPRIDRVDPPPVSLSSGGRGGTARSHSLSLSLSSVFHPKTTAKFDAAAADAKLSNLAASCCRATRELEFLSVIAADGDSSLSLFLPLSLSFFVSYFFISKNRM